MSTVLPASDYTKLIANAYERNYLHISSANEKMDDYRKSLLTQLKKK
jgi:hypothetical protein